MKLMITLTLDKEEQLRCRKCNWMISENEDAVLVAEPDQSGEIFAVAVFCKLCVYDVEDELMIKKEEDNE